MIEIIPAIDIIEGKCVRLSQGDYDSKKVYNENPAEIAKQFEDCGVKRLHIVDLDGAKSQHIVNQKVLENIASTTSLTIDFGGGLKTDADIDSAFNAGASMVTVGSIAVKNSPLFCSWLTKYGSERIILGADAKNGYISVNGWKEESSDELIPFLERYVAKGVNRVLCTDISRDGMLQGPAVELYSQIMQRFPDMKLIASGGVSCIDDIRALNEAGIPSVVFGKAIYEGKIGLNELKEFF